MIEKLVRRTVKTQTQVTSLSYCQLGVSARMGKKMPIYPFSNVTSGSERLCVE